MKSFKSCLTAPLKGMEHFKIGIKAYHIFAIESNMLFISNLFRVSEHLFAGNEAVVSQLTS